MLANTPYLWYFFQVTLFYFCKAVFRWKHYKNSIFSRAQLLGITDSKPLFEAPSQNGTFCNQKCPFLDYPLCLLKPQVFVVFGDFEWAQKKTIFQKQIVATKMRSFFNISNTNSVCLFFENAISAKKHLLCSQPPKTLFFWAFFFLIFCFPYFSFFLFFFLQHKKTKIESAHFFECLLTPWQTAKKLFSHPYTLFAFFKITKKHFKIGENKQKKSWTKFWRNLGPSVDSKDPILDQVLTLQHIYIYVVESKFAIVLSRKSVQGWVEDPSKIFCLFSPVL